MQLTTVDPASGRHSGQKWGQSVILSLNPGTIDSAEVKLRGNAEMLW